MRKRYLFGSAAVAVCVLGVAIAVACYKPVERRTFGGMATQVRMGQTREEVTRIMGCSPGRYSDPETNYNFRPVFPPGTGREIVGWYGTDVAVQVLFERGGNHVVDVRTRSVLPPGVR